MGSPPPSSPLSWPSRHTHPRDSCQLPASRGPSRGTGILGFLLRQGAGGTGVLSMIIASSRCCFVSGRVKEVEAPSPPRRSLLDLRGRIATGTHSTSNRPLPEGRPARFRLAYVAPGVYTSCSGTRARAQTSNLSLTRIHGGEASDAPGVVVGSATRRLLFLSPTLQHRLDSFRFLKHRL